MSYRAVVYDEFPGLRVGAPDKPGAIDLLNVELRDGRVGSRSCLAYWTTVAAASRYTYLYAAPTVVAAGRTAATDIIDSAGAVITSDANALTAAAAVGTPSSTNVYLADGTNAVRRYTASAITAGTALATVDGTAGLAMPKAKNLCVQPDDNRLVVAGTASSGGPNGATSSTSHVWFSEPGAPESWTSTNYVQLTPGDGEDIVGVVEWRGQVYVFKQSRFFVFYGNSVDSAGNPIFNYRTVEMRHPGTIVGSKAIVAGDLGVYFAAFPGGLYRTTGDVPVKVDADMAQEFEGRLNQATGSPFRSVSLTANAVTDAALGWASGRIFLYAVDTSSTTPRLFVFDEQRENWLNWNVNMTCMASMPPSFAVAKTDPVTPLFTLGTSAGAYGNHIAYLDRDATTDALGSGVVAYYVASFDPMGSFENKRVREWIVEGSGSVSFQSAHDMAFGANYSTAATLSMGTFGSAVTQARYRVAKKGRNFNFSLTSVSSGQWEIQRVTAELAGRRRPGVN